jgi:UPF0042 nucleotide-binding protein
MSVPRIHLYSFGFKYSGPPPDESGHGGGFVFDCRALPNPYWDETLRPFAGTEPPIVAYLDAQPEVGEFARHATELVKYTATAYARLNRERLMVAFGCTGGRHRSVYLAERLKRELELAGFPVVLVHRDVERERNAVDATASAGTRP